MFFPESILEEIKSRVDFLAFISRYVDLKRAGANYKGLCPFHQEKTPSFMVSPNKAIYKCFGCGVGGNLFTFLRDIENISFVEAVRMLAAESGVVLPAYSSKQSQEEESESELLYRINDRARAFFCQALQSDEAKKAREYLAGRAITLETATAFSIGYAPDSYDALRRHLSADFEEEVLVRAGLLVKREDGKVYDKFRRRLVFTIQNLSGLTCGFSCRVLNPDDNPKYLNSPETTVFQKGRLLYGLLQARDAIRKENRAVIVEGNVDLITLFQGGIKNVVASLGTAFTDSHALLLKRFCSQVTLLYDGDSAGQSSAKRGLNLLLNAGLSVRVVSLPSKEDPDSYFKKNGKEAMEALLKTGKDVVDFLIDHFSTSNDLSVAENKSKLVQEMAPLLSELTDPVIKAEYVRKAALRIGTREEFFIPKGNIRKWGATNRDATQPAADVTPVSIDALEEEMVSLMVRAPQAVLSLAQRYLKKEDFSHPSFQTMYLIMLEEGTFDESMLASLEADAQKIASAMMMAEPPKSDGQAADDMKALLLRFRRRRLENERAQIKQQMSQCTDEEEKLKLMARFQEITARIHSALDL
ncbi:MAG: DNA primase [Elusimicrobia bacterium RIFOXYB2_FULL_49_7]|nr:MAG: DNA primase [Elusimicrobia bacterium RIFOXYB2_FULL_49_7]